MFAKLRRRADRERLAEDLYSTAVGQARNAAFYRELGVPDSLDGRFEMIAIHVFLLLHRLKDGGSNSAELSQALFDIFFADMDRNLREMGAGDLGVGRRVRRMAEGFSGRVRAYDAALLADQMPELEAALRRNLYGTLPAPPAASITRMAQYLRAQSADLAAQSEASILCGEVRFGPLEITGAEGFRKPDLD